MNRDLIETVLLDQNHEAQQILKSGGLVDRTVLKNNPNFKKSKLIKVIMGIRRCGKSTLALQLASEQSFVYVNFDDERLSDIKTQDLNELLKIIMGLFPGRKTLILDEIQNVDRWELFVNRLKRSNYNLIITGSNSKLLSKELATHLTGRHLSLELMPFSFIEFLNYNCFSNFQRLTTDEESKITALFNQYIEQGGFPEVLQGETAGPYLRELFNKIIMQDVMFRKKIRNSSTFKELSIYICSHFSSLITFQSLSRMLKIKTATSVKNYIDFLQEAYLIFMVEPFSYKFKERISLPRKIYSIDVALSQALGGKFTQDLGLKLENIIYLELRRRALEIYQAFATNYDVDFAIREQSQIVKLIQVCWSLKDERTRKRELGSLRAAARALKCKELMIITAFEEELIEYDGFNVRVLPAWKWLLN